MAAFAERLKTPFLAGYVSVLNEAHPYTRAFAAKGLGGMKSPEAATALSADIERLRAASAT